MKKLLIIALAVIPVLFACKKSNTTPTTPDLETPTYAKQAAKVELSTPITLKTKKGNAAIKKIDFLRGGSYIAEAIIAKADEQTTTLTGTWTFTAGKGYVIKGEIEATVSVDKSGGSSATVTVTTTEEGAQTSQATVEETKVQDCSTEDKI